MRFSLKFEKNGNFICSVLSRGEGLTWFCEGRYTKLLGLDNTRKQGQKLSLRLTIEQNNKKKKY